MMMLTGLPFVFIAISVTVTSHESERDLTYYLLRQYDPRTRPVNRPSDVVTVQFHMILQQVVDLDEKNQILTTSVVVKLQWQDGRLSWNPKKFNHQRDLILHSQQVWLPDIYVFNNAAGGEHGFLFANESRPLVQHSGEITWIVPMTIHSSCSIDALYFPFDQQFCQVQFASWMHDMSQVHLQVMFPQQQVVSSRRSHQIPSDDDEDESHLLIEGVYVENSELALRRVQLLASEKATRNMAPHSQVILKLYIQRKPLFYAYTVIAPGILLCLFTVFSFWLPSDCAEKIEMGLTVFLFLYFLQLMIAENTPESNSCPLIGTFLSMIMTLNSLSLIMATVVLHVKRRGSGQIISTETSSIQRMLRVGLGPPAVPPWLWWLVGRVLAPMTTFWCCLCCRGTHASEDDEDSSSTTSSHSENAMPWWKHWRQKAVSVRDRGSFSIYDEMAERRFIQEFLQAESSGDAAATAESASIDGFIEHDCSDWEGQPNHTSAAVERKRESFLTSQQTRRTTAEVSRISHRQPICSRHSMSQPIHEVDNDNEEATTNIDMVAITLPELTEMQARVEAGRRLYRWRYVADVIDSALFQIYFVGTVVGVLILLVYLPYYGAEDSTHE